LVINFNKFSQEVTALLIEYQSDEPITNFSNFTGNRKITPIVYNPITYTNTTAKEYYECVKITIYICTKPDSGHNPGDPGCEAPPLVGYECSFLFDNDGGGNTSGTGTTTTSSTSTGSGSGVATSPVYTMSTLEKQRKTFTTSLSAEIKTWMADPVNVNIKEALYSYLEYSNADTGDLAYMPQKCDFVKQYVTQTILTNLNLDLNYSLKSPAFIDFSSIDKNTPEGAKFTEVYNALIKSPTFKNLFINLFNETPLFNVKFRIENLPQSNPNDYLTGLCTYTNINSLNALNIIRIDKDFLMNKSKADIALTIIHECMHAFLNIKFRNPSIGMSIDNINNMDLQQCINTYYNGFSGNQTQHSFFVNNMRPTLVQILNDIKDFIITPSQANEMENPTNGSAFIYAPLNNPPTMSISNTQIQWNWNTFFNYFSYFGLHNCTAYPYTNPVNSSHVFLNNDDYYHYKYISAFNAIFNP